MLPELKRNYETEKDTKNHHIKPVASLVFLLNKLKYENEIIT